jgi:hypothetical protein
LDKRLSRLEHRHLPEWNKVIPSPAATHDQTKEHSPSGNDTKKIKALCISKNILKNHSAVPFALAPECSFNLRHYSK